MKFFIFTAIALLVAATPANSQDSGRSAIFNVEKGHAIQGYDPVAYFKDSKAVKGSDKISIGHQGITYYFSSEANRDAFKAKPEAYEPQYGGWCAYAIGDSGEQVEIDPKTFKIIDGKLYLFYNFYFTNTLTTWNKDEKNLKAKADKNWTKIIQTVK